MKLIETLGYEQLKALLILSATDDVEASALCFKADCSWAELFALGKLGLIDPGMERVAPKQFHPVLTNLGREAAQQAKDAGFSA